MTIKDLYFNLVKMKESVINVSIIGAGTWGSALANIISSCSNVTLYCVTKRNYSYLKNERRHPKLQYFSLNSNVKVLPEIDQCVCYSPVIILAVSSQYIRTVARLLSEFSLKNNVICVASKGIEVSTGKTLSEVVAEELPNLDIAVLSGGSHAEEVCLNLPFGMVIAGSRNTRLLIKNIFKQSQAVLSEQDDPIVLEYLSSVKNLLAIGAGIADGLNLGDNFRGYLISDGYREACQYVHANIVQALSYGGLGDLITTALSRNSRNYKYGLLRGRGFSHERALSTIDMAVEGFSLAEIVKQQKWNNCPILNNLAKVITSNSTISRNYFIHALK